MTKITRGYVEIFDAGDWRSVLRIDDIVGQVPEITSILFGIDDHRLKKPIAPKACNRGLPDNASDETRMAFERDRSLAHFDTYITPVEIAEVFEVKEVKKGWPLVFGFMGLLTEMYGEGSVRLIVWFI